MRAARWPGWSGSSSTASCWAGPSRRRKFSARGWSRWPPQSGEESTGKTVAFFSITSNNLITVRTSDYVAQMVGMAGGVYIFDRPRGGQPGGSPSSCPLEDLLRPGQRRRCPHLQQHQAPPCSSKVPHAGGVQGCPVRRPAGVRPRACSSRAWSWPDLILRYEPRFYRGGPASLRPFCSRSYKKGALPMTTTRRLSLPPTLALTASPAVRAR